MGSQDHTMHSRISSLRGLGEGSIYFFVFKSIVSSAYGDVTNHQMPTKYIQTVISWGQRSAPGWQLQHDEAGDGWHRQTPSRWKHYLLESGNFWRCLICLWLGKHILLGEIIKQETCWAKEKEYYNKKAPTDEKDKLRPEFKDWSKGDWAEVHGNRIPARWILKMCQYRFWILKCIFLYLSQACLHSRVCHRINLQNHLRGHNGWKA